MQSRFTWIIVLLSVPVMLWGQWGNKGQRDGIEFRPSNLTLTLGQLQDPTPARSLPLHAVPTFDKLGLALAPGVQMELKNKSNGSLWLKGEMDETYARRLERKDRNLAILRNSALKSKVAAQDFKLVSERANEQVVHSKYQHIHEGLPVFGNELTLHVQEDQRFDVVGRLQSYPFASAKNIMGEEKATSILTQDLEEKNISVWSASQREHNRLLLAVDRAELVWYHHEGVFRKSWHMTYHPDLAGRWEYFIDAENGEVLHSYESICKFHDHGPYYFDGKSVGTGVDLDGINQTVQTYEVGNVHILMDATKDMFVPTPNLPSDPQGVIITLDATNTFPGHDNFKYQELLSNSTTWNDPDAVSAHINASKVYDYFKLRHGRTSIDNRGRNIISLINVADEEGDAMDNAFWNGLAIFYGKGNRAFSSPLARALDVAGHEMAHGVIETSANLEYQGESGALNESFADVFGIMVESVQIGEVDWNIGEDVVNRNIFRAGLRNILDPHNGGNSLNDPGYQPAHYSERFTGSEDNHGVHINSGIVNRAFALFVVKLQEAVSPERVYYNVLTNYLTRSSQFVDMRIATIAASEALYANRPEVAQAAREAFDEVGILGDQGGNYSEDVEVNPGEDLILLSSLLDGQLTIVDPDGNLIEELEVNGFANTPPSISDDGSRIAVITDDKRMHLLQFNGQKYVDQVVQNDPIWNTVAISKDGLKIAAVLDEVSDSVFVFDLVQNTGRIFELYNPTSANNISTADIRYADALEWDHSGEFLMYDALNSLHEFGSDEAFEYWDIGFIRVWDNASNNYGDGYVTKLFSGLQEGQSVANPTFSKNSPYIIAFDYLDARNDEPEFSVLGVNIETSDVGTIFRNSVAGYPSFSRLDDQVIFDAEADDGTNVFEVLAIVGLAEDKINGLDNASVFYRDAIWGEWFGTGQRDLVSVLEGDKQDTDLTIYPNPTEATLFLEAEWLPQVGAIQVDIISLDGRVIQSVVRRPAASRIRLQTGSLAAGVYTVRLRNDVVNRVYKMVKR